MEYPSTLLMSQLHEFVNLLTPVDSNNITVRINGGSNEPSPTLPSGISIINVILSFSVLTFYYHMSLWYTVPLFDFPKSSNGLKPSKKKNGEKDSEELINKYTGFQTNSTIGHLNVTSTRGTKRLWIKFTT